jgi:lipid II:glycine glycyltransferase (peptidoglycan interpeptide bridge formation enzyme)
LIWEQIQWLKDHGIRFFDLGGIDPEANPGGYRFKSGLSGRDVRHIGEFEACAGGLSRRLVHGAERARAAFRSLRTRVQHRPELLDAGHT